MRMHGMVCIADVYAYIAWRGVKVRYWWCAWCGVQGNYWMRGSNRGSNRGTDARIKLRQGLLMVASGCLGLSGVACLKSARNAPGQCLEGMRNPWQR